MKTIDEFTHLAGKVSRQRIWTLRRNRDGLCGICGKPRNHVRYYCDSCATKYSHFTGKNLASKELAKECPNLGIAIKRLRGWNLLNQKELGDMIDVGQSTIFQWENGGVRVPPVILERLAKALDVTVEELKRLGSKSP